MQFRYLPWLLTSYLDLMWPTFIRDQSVNKPVMYASSANAFKKFDNTATSDTLLYMSSRFLHRTLCNAFLPQLYMLLNEAEHSPDTGYSWSDSEIIIVSSSVEAYKNHSKVVSMHAVHFTVNKKLEWLVWVLDYMSQKMALIAVIIQAKRSSTRTEWTSESEACDALKSSS